MVLHQFELLEFGIFDSRVKFPNITVTEYRPVEHYEIEILMGDFGGCSYINGIAYPHSGIDFICAKPGQQRRSRLPFKCYYIHLEPKNQEAKKLLDRLPGSMKIGDTQQYAALFHKLLQASFSDPDTERLAYSAGLSQILMLALRDGNIGSFQSGVVGNKKALLLAESYLCQHFRENITLPVLADVASLSPVYFHKLFTAHFHKTPNEYLLELRLAHAKQLLLEEAYSLADIAMGCGFASQSYFCYRFKSAVGLTPLQYRRQELSKVGI